MKKNRELKKKKKHISKKVKILIGLLLLGFLAGLISAFFSQEKDSHLEPFKTIGEPTDLEHIDMDAGLVKFVENNEVPNETYQKIENIALLSGDEYILYLYGGVCGDNCMNKKLIEKLKELHEEGETIHFFDINKISKIYLTLLLNNQNNYKFANFIYVKEGIITDNISIDANEGDFSKIPTSKQNSFSAIQEFDKLENKLDNLVKYYEFLHPEFTDEEVLELAKKTLENYEKNNK